MGQSVKSCANEACGGAWTGREAAGSDPERGWQTHELVSDEARLLKLERLKAAIEAGTYRVPSFRVAESLLGHMLERR